MLPGLKWYLPSGFSPGCFLLGVFVVVVGHQAPSFEDNNIQQGRNPLVPVSGLFRICEWLPLNLPTFRADIPIPADCNFRVERSVHQAIFSLGTLLALLQWPSLNDLFRPEPAHLGTAVFDFSVLSWVSQWPDFVPVMCVNK
jgi:hypothetical protein